MLRKKWMAGVGLVAALFLSVPESRAAGIAGVDVGAMIASENLDDFVDSVGGSASPYVGYMLTDYVGFMSQVQFWGVGSKSRPGVSDDITWVLGGLVGPRLALPLGNVELYGTGQWGFFTSLADAALTDSSWGASAGGGIDIGLGEGWYVGAFGRWNRLYQRVHGVGDPQYFTAGATLAYKWGVPEPAMPIPPPPPPPARVAEAPPPPPPPPVQKKIVLRGVNFDFDRSEIRADAQPVLDEAIATLKSEGGIAVIAEGHTDAIGSDAYNDALSLRRANAVKDYLVAGGIDAARIQVEGFGESRPVATNDTEDGRAQNRRVELRVLER